MKLSKQERLGILIVAIILILGLGTWLFIVPKIEALNASSTTLTTKQTELDDAKAEAARKDPLKQQVLDAYKEGESLADMFFEEMTTYEADMEFRAFLEQCKSNILVESISVSEPTTSTLAPEYFTKDEVIYPLKTYVTQGLEKTEEEIASEERWNELKNALGVSQTVGSITVDFTVNTVEPEDLLAFADEVNNYIKLENGKDTRKAMILNGASITLPLVEDQYQQLITQIDEESMEEAIDQLYKHLGKKRPQGDGTGSSDDEEKEEEEASPSDYYYQLSTSITFYSVERMQDPTEQLDAQEQ
ncbi:MAG: hypothetical protein E7485_03330 [Ruminococcaceae bacterium]|nr:hypothetical protein [Oscillospiraceae bacterium]